MAATRTEPKAAPADRSRTRHARHNGARRARTERAGKISEDVFQEVEDGQRAAIQAVKEFIDTVDKTLPPRTDGPSPRQTVVDAAMDMADKLVHVQYDFLRKVVRSAGKSVER
ncbi:MAG TPA: hypothetical protein VFU94_02900 [Conexibacter sp.]|nr:hypothetical protein [Conexibacter sp.]